MSANSHRYFCINKPHTMLSQFIGGDEGMTMLGSLDFAFPEGIHAVGRLDNNSEGLLLLTTNKKVTKLLFQGETEHKRTYLVLVKQEVSPETLTKLQTGISIRIKGGEYYITPPCDVQIVAKPERLYKGEFDFKDEWPHTWLRITLTEGKYHQVRKMVFEAGHRCLRLIRLSIEDMELGDMQPGEVREMDEEEFFGKLRIENWN